MSRVSELATDRISCHNSPSLRRCSSISQQRDNDALTMERLETHEAELLVELEVTRRLMGKETVHAKDFNVFRSRMPHVRKWQPRDFKRLDITPGYSVVSSRTAVALPSTSSIFSDDSDSDNSWTDASTGNRSISRNHSRKRSIVDAHKSSKKHLNHHIVKPVRNRLKINVKPLDFIDSNKIPKFDYKGHNPKGDTRYHESGGRYSWDNSTNNIIRSSSSPCLSSTLRNEENVTSKNLCKTRKSPLGKSPHSVGTSFSTKLSIASPDVHSPHSIRPSPNSNSPQDSLRRTNRNTLNYTRSLNGSKVTTPIQVSKLSTNCSRETSNTPDSYSSPQQNNLSIPIHLRSDCNSPASVGSAISASASRSHRRKRMSTVAAVPPSLHGSCLSDNDMLDLLAGFRKYDISCIVFDFDQTFVSIHTAIPYWRGPLATLATYVRPLFSLMVRVGMKSGFRVAIATNNRRPDRILSMLHYAFPELDTSEIVVRGKDGSWHADASWSREKKVPFVLSVVQEFQRRFHRDSLTNEKVSNHALCKRNVLMIDDDMMNVMACNLNGIRAVHLDTDLVIDGRNCCEEQIADQLWGQFMEGKPAGAKHFHVWDDTETHTYIPKRILKFRRAFSQFSATGINEDPACFWAEDMNSDEDDNTWENKKIDDKISIYNERMHTSKPKKRDGHCDLNINLSTRWKSNGRSNEQQTSASPLSPALKSEATLLQQSNSSNSLLSNRSIVSNDPAALLSISGHQQNGIALGKNAASISHVGVKISPNTLPPPVPMSLASSFRIAADQRAAAVALQACVRGRIQRKRFMESNKTFYIS